MLELWSGDLVQAATGAVTGIGLALPGAAAVITLDFEAFFFRLR